MKHEIPDVGVGEIIEGGVGEVRVVEGVEPADNVQSHGYLKLFRGGPEGVEGRVSVGAAVKREPADESCCYASLRNPAQLSGAFCYVQEGDVGDGLEAVRVVAAEVEDVFVVGTGVGCGYSWSPERRFPSGGRGSGR